MLCAICPGAHEAQGVVTTLTSDMVTSAQILFDPGAMAPSQRLQFDAAHIAMALSFSLSDVAALRLMFLMDGLQ